MFDHLNELKRLKNYHLAPSNKSSWLHGIRMRRYQTFPDLHSATTLKWLVCVSQKMTVSWCHPVLYTALHTALHQLLYRVLNRSISTPEMSCKKILVKWDVGRVNGTRVILCINTDQGLLNLLQLNLFWVVDKRLERSLLGAESMFCCPLRHDSAVLLYSWTDCGTAELSRKTTHPSSHRTT